MDFCVNLLQGTNSSRDFSRGNTLPLVARPFGMHHWTPQTASAPWFFHPDHKKLQGIRLTHQPSPWMGDYGSMLITAFCGEICETIEEQSSAYRLEQADLSPHRLGVFLLRYGMRVDMAPTERGAVFTFARSSSDAITVRFEFDGTFSIRERAGEKRLFGVSRNHSGGVAEPFGLHFVAEFDQAPVEFRNTRNGICLIFARETDRVELRLAGSFISEDLAISSLRRELLGQSFSEIARKGATAWEELLGRIQIEAENQLQRTTFYSCLYRCLLFPRFLDEIDQEGRVIHYDPYRGGTGEGSLCADNGFWDTFRTVYPLLGLAYPQELIRILRGWLTACRESGWTPRWASPGPRNCMIGTYFDVVVADAVARGVVDWEVDEAFHYLWKDATEPGDGVLYGRPELEDYIRLGYVPSDKYPYSVSCTLDYSYADFCVAQAARFLGRTREADILAPRTQFYRNIFDPDTGFMRGRRADGTWQTPFHEFRWGGEYIEGGPWQHSFHVPHDPAGLISLHGGSQAFCDRMDRMLATPAHFESGSYGFEIHEMTEMALAGFGQYAHSNQPVHGFLFLYSFAGHPEKTSYWVRRVASELYSLHAFPGDEDNGEMSAWYVFAALGIYPHCPGSPGYVHFEPITKSASILGKPLTAMKHLK